MSKRRGRPPRQYNLRVRTERRDPIDFAALARAALEQAAMDERNSKNASESPRRQKTPHTNRRAKEVRHDDLE